MPNKDAVNTGKSDTWSVRKEYTRSNLEETALSQDPLEQFGKWYNEALSNQIDELNAMALATSDRSGSVKVRFVLLKGFDQQGFQFFTNYESPKAVQLTQNPRASLAIYWKELERQVRIEGQVERLAATESDKYFGSRPREAQLGAWASNQSQTLSSRLELEQRFQELEQKFAAYESIPRPPHWGGFLLIPERYEFWQGRVGRLHDRFEYSRKVSQSWSISRLSP